MEIEYSLIRNIIFSPVSNLIKKCSLQSLILLFTQNDTAQDKMYKHRFVPVLQ